MLQLTGNAEGLRQIITTNLHDVDPPSGENFGQSVDALTALYLDLQHACTDSEGISREVEVEVAVACQRVRAVTHHFQHFIDLGTRGHIRQHDSYRTDVEQTLDIACRW